MRSPVPVAGPVEAWMLAVEGEMRATLHALAKQGVHSYVSLPRACWIEASLGMVGLVGSAIWWTWETEDAFRRMAAGEKSALKVRALAARCHVCNNTKSQFACHRGSILAKTPTLGQVVQTGTLLACHVALAVFCLQ